MTHDELLAKLSSSQVFGKQFGAKAYLALRAVVELHKTQDITLPNGEWGINCSHCNLWTFPCPTIQAIEKELG